MIIGSSLSFSSATPTVVALGCFDGVHLGHTAVIQAAKAQALRQGCLCAVWTFEEPPKNYFFPNSVSLITTRQAKETLLRQLGVDLLACVPFDQSVASMSAETFFENILLFQMRACHLVCGYNYTFGAKGAGDVSLLQALCDAHGIGLTVLPPVTVGGVSVSSSAIRSAMEDGRPEDAAALLGRPYSLTAPVVDGQKLARALGFPTLNQIFPHGALIPKAGVYATRVTLPHATRSYGGISNVGIRPTVTDHTLCCETHLFDFSGDLYQVPVTVEFLSFLRPERKFASLEAMSEQIRKDMDTVRAYLNEHEIL